MVTVTVTITLESVGDRWRQDAIDTLQHYVYIHTKSGLP